MYFNKIIFGFYFGFLIAVSAFLYVNYEVNIDNRIEYLNSGLDKIVNIYHQVRGNLTEDEKLVLLKNLDKENSDKPTGVSIYRYDLINDETGESLVAKNKYYFFKNQKYCVINDVKNIYAFHKTTVVINGQVKTVVIVLSRKVIDVVLSQVFTLIFILSLTFLGFIMALYSSYLLNNYTDTIKYSQNLKELMDESLLISITNSKGEITYANEQFANRAECKVQELLGKNHKVLNSGYHDQAFWKNMYDTTIKYKAIWNDIVYNKSLKENYYVIKSWIKAMFDHDGKLTGHYRIAIDITELYDKQEEIKRKSDIMEKVSFQTRHDLRNVLQIYLPNTVKVLLKKYPEDSTVKTLGRINESIDTIYKGIYNFSNLVRPDKKLDLTQIDFTDFAKKYFNNTTYAKNVTVSDNINLLCNPFTLIIAIDNLVRNGLKYNESTVKNVDIYMEGDFLCIHDNGLGFDFSSFIKPFQRGSTDKDGTGLGISICKSIIQAHNWTIEQEDVELGTKLKIKIK